jgi:hypothetical protein
MGSPARISCLGKVSRLAKIKFNDIGVPLKISNITELTFQEKLQ